MITMYSMWVMMMFTLVPAMYCLKHNFNIILEWDILSTITTQLMFSLILDNTSLMYSSTVLFISANVLTFSISYMSGDKFINRFTLLVVAFVISMNLLIYIPHLIMLLIGWDGLGITSFILIIYYQNPKSLAAGLITALTNRIGDVAILLSIAWTMNQGHWNILHMMTSSNSMFQILMILIAASTKSAQMPFSSWLPAAMAAPTPVSALVHSSTLVTAGVFLLIRFYPFLSTEPMFNKTILFLAVSTLVMSGISATTECDMKKIIALSTLSQLGMMMTSIGLGFQEMAFIHMVIHAMFKALLFICAGNLINFHSHAQDLRWMGNVSESMPMTSSCLLVANSALCGLPFMSGFYSKDLIIETSMFNSYNMLMIILIVFSVALTSLYSVRMSVTTLWGPRMHKSLSNSKDDLITNKPMLKMSIMSIFLGSLVMWTLPNTQPTLLLPTYMKFSTIVMVIVGLLTGWLLSQSYSTSHSKMMTYYVTHYASCMMWFLIPTSSQLMLKMPMHASHLLLKHVDQSWLELIGGQGMYSSIITGSSSLTNYSPMSINQFFYMSSICLLLSMPVLMFMY